MLTRESKIDTGQFFVTAKATKVFILNGKQIKTGEEFQIRQRDLPLVANVAQLVR